MATTTVRGGTSTRRQATKRTAAPARPAKPRATAGAAKRPTSDRPVGRAVVAAERAVHRDMVQISLPVVGELHLPPTEEIVFLGGTAFLAAVGVLEWPVALLFGAGHILAVNGRNKVVRAMGETLEEV